MAALHSCAPLSVDLRDDLRTHGVSPLGFSHRLRSELRSGLAHRDFQSPIPVPCSLAPPTLSVGAFRCMDRSSALVPTKGEEA